MGQIKLKSGLEFIKMHLLMVFKNPIWVRSNSAVKFFLEGMDDFKDLGEVVSLVCLISTC